METFDTVEGQNKAVARASVKDYVDRMSLSELRKVENFISGLRQTDCSQSELIDGLSFVFQAAEHRYKCFHESVENDNLPTDQREYRKGHSDAYLSMIDVIKEAQKG